MPVCTGYDHLAELIGTDHVEWVISYLLRSARFLAPPSRLSPAQQSAGPLSKSARLLRVYVRLGNVTDMLRLHSFDAMV
jgi:hypothetical protein